VNFVFGYTITEEEARLMHNKSVEYWDIQNEIEERKKIKREEKERILSLLT
jgi:hypothetical protein